MFCPLVTLLAVLGLELAATADLVCDWNNHALSPIRNESTPPPLAARNLAILHVAIYDSANTIARTHASYLTNVAVAGECSSAAAISAAAHRVLVNLFPSQTATFDSAMADFLSGVPNDFKKTNGIAVGEATVEIILNLRAGDGASTSVPYIPSKEPGAWRRTLPFDRPQELPQWRYVKPFAMKSGDQFRPAGPPPLNSTNYAVDVNQVKSLGALNSTTRSNEQTLVARFWSDFNYTVTPPGHWNQIAQNVATNRPLSLEQNARLFALLNLALADAAIAVWDAKYAYNFWRPVTAIREADRDGNPETVAAPEWLPLLNTPSFPEYPSGHSAFSGAAATVLARFCGTDSISFTVGSDTRPGVFRSYRSFSSAADEIGMSRIYGGIHFLSADLDGLEVGRRVGAYVQRNFLLPLAATNRLTSPQR